MLYISFFAKNELRNLSYDNREKLKTQTKCTLTLSELLIIEILPIPLTSLVCLYVIRKRPKWLPGIVDRLYAEKDIKLDTTSSLFDEKKSMVTRRQCTISLSIMIFLDFLIPFTILVGLYVTQRRPIWFKNIVSRLYVDLIVNNEKTDSLLGNTSGESLFLRKLVLGIPAQASGKNLTRPLMPSAPQPSCVRATSPHHRKLGAGYVSLPQMTGRRFGKPFILSPPTLALRFRQNNGPTPSGDYQPSRSLSMAGSD
jgi:hypothetical protein